MGAMKSTTWLAGSTVTLSGLCSGPVLACIPLQHVSKIMSHIRMAHIQERDKDIGAQWEVRTRVSVTMEPLNEV